MKYTYEISFNGSDYSDLTPGNEIEMSGEWLEGTKIWRESISDLKITKAQNSTIYNTLESWFEDPTKFETRIFIKILKNNVQDSLHWFGIKWGTLNKDNTTYEVQPIAYDFWGRYFENIFETDATSPTSLSTDTYAIYNEDANKTTRTILFGKPFLDWIKDTFCDGGICDWPSADILSSILSGDNYEDTSALPTLNGVKKDYVTDDQSVMIDAGYNVKFTVNMANIFEAVRLFNILAFFDSNDKLRFEHTKFFIEKLEDNAVDFSAFIESYDNEFSYEETNIPTTQKLSLRYEEDQTDVKFSKEFVKYSDVRNRPDMQVIENTFSSFSDIDYYLDNSQTHDRLIYSNAVNMVYDWTNVSMSTFLSSVNSIDAISLNVSSLAKSNYLNIQALKNYPLVVHADTFTASIMYVSLRNASTGAAVSNVVNISGTGDTSVNLSTTWGGEAYLRIEINTGRFVGYITLGRSTSGYYHVPIMDAQIGRTAENNAHFAADNILYQYWNYDGLSRSGTLNGTAYTFNGTQYNLKRKDVHFNYSGVINPLHGFNDGTRIGEIQSWTRSLDTDFYTISVNYQEDEYIEPTGIGAMAVGSTFIIA